MIIKINIRIEGELTPEEISPNLKEWVLMNFRPETDVLFEIFTEKENLKFSMKEYVKGCKAINEAKKNKELRGKKKCIRK